MNDNKQRQIKLLVLQDTEVLASHRKAKENPELFSPADDLP